MVVFSLIPYPCGSTKNRKARAEAKVLEECRGIARTGVDFCREKYYNKIMEQEDQPILWYCDYIAGLPDGENKELNKNYHDNQYGFPIHDDNELFGRLILEINQAGLSWTTILKKQHSLRKAFDGFDIKKIAAYGDVERTRLLADSGIIRNRLKVDAIIHNAKVVTALQKEYGSFESWLSKNHPLTKDEWIKLFKRRFKFVGGEIVNEFLVSTGYLKGAHQETCPFYRKTLTANPKWNEKMSKDTSNRLKERH